MGKRADRHLHLHGEKVSKRDGDRDSDGRREFRRKKKGVAVRKGESLLVNLQGEVRILFHWKTNRPNMESHAVWEKGKKRTFSRGGAYPLKSGGSTFSTKEN